MSCFVCFLSGIPPHGIWYGFRIEFPPKLEQVDPSFSELPPRASLFAANYFCFIF